MVQFCEILEVPANGTVNTTETIEGTVVEFSCNFGYVISNDDVIVCQQNPNQLPGDWSSEEPTCNSKSFVI